MMGRGSTASRGPRTVAHLTRGRLTLLALLVAVLKVAGVGVLQVGAGRMRPPHRWHHELGQRCVSCHQPRRDPT
jgi:mono/diheme cytochrome c family protein